MDSTLNLHEKWQLRLHLMTCEFCRLFDKQMSQLESKIKTNITKIQIDSSLKLSDSKKNEIKEKMKSKKK